MKERKKALFCLLPKAAILDRMRLKRLWSDGYGFESSLARYLDKGSVHWRGAQDVNVQWSVH